MFEKSVGNSLNRIKSEISSTYLYVIMFRLSIYLARRGSGRSGNSFNVSNKSNYTWDVVSILIYQLFDEFNGIRIKNAGTILLFNMVSSNAAKSFFVT